MGVGVVFSIAVGLKKYVLRINCSDMEFFSSFIINALKSNTKLIHPNCHITLLSLVAYTNAEMIKYYAKDGQTEFVVPTLHYEGFADIILSEDFNNQENIPHIEEIPQEDEQVAGFYDDFTNYKSISNDIKKLELKSSIFEKIEERKNIFIEKRRT